MIQVFKPYFDNQEIKAVTKVLKSGWIGLGPKTAEFEKKFAKFTGSKHAIAVNSATAGLHMAVRILKDEYGSGEVIVPTMTFVSTAFAAEYENMKVVFVDVEPDTLNIDIEDLKRKITKKTKIVIPVHYGGNAANIKEIMKLSKKHKFAVIEDVAHATGSYLGKKHLGTFGHIGVFSFHAVKNLATGDGGMLITNNNKYAKKANRLKWVGIDKDTYARSKSKGYDWKYSIKEVGYKYHLNDILSSIGLVQLKKLPKANAKRRQIATEYRKAFKDVDWIHCLKITKDCKPAQHNFVVIVDKSRDKLRQYLKAKGIQSGVHYNPVHLFEFYKNKGLHKCPVAEKIWKNLITLPLYPDMTDKDVKTVIKAIKSF